MQVLTALSESFNDSLRDRAQHSGIPIATFLRRLHLLQEKKIIPAVCFRYNLDVLGISQYRLLLKVGTTSAAMTQKILKVCEQLPQVKLCTICLGAWDYEFEFDTFSVFEASSVTKKFKHVLGRDLIAQELLPILKHNKYVSFPVVEE